MICTGTGAWIRGALIADALATDVTPGVHQCIINLALANLRSRHQMLWFCGG